MTVRRDSVEASVREWSEKLDPGELEAYRSLNLEAKREWLRWHLPPSLLTGGEAEQTALVVAQDILGEVLADEYVEREPGTFAALFDGRIRTLIGGRLAQVAYQLALYGLALLVVGAAVGAAIIALQSHNYLVAFAVLIGTPILAILTLVWVRLALEQRIVHGRILTAIEDVASELRELRKSLSAR